MTEERLSSQLYRRITEFVDLGTSRGVSNFCLSGPGNVPTLFGDFAAIFPQRTSQDINFAIVVTTPGIDQKSYYDRILALEIPDRVRAMRIREDPLLRVIMEQAMLARGLPSIVLAIGETQDTKERNIFLLCIAGISPENALTELQEKVRERKVRLN